jgi:hypothetical protein
MCSSQELHEMIELGEEQVSYNEQSSDNEAGNMPLNSVPGTTGSMSTTIHNTTGIQGGSSSESDK